MIFEVLQKVNVLVREFHGSYTAEHNDGLLRTPYLEELFGPEVCALFEQTERIFDPLGIFNPGKKTGTDEAYIKAHVDAQ
jgi:FAD/FMN-containing dehydrogenase